MSLELSRSLTQRIAKLVSVKPLGEWLDRMADISRAAGIDPIKWVGSGMSIELQAWTFVDFAHRRTLLSELSAAVVKLETNG